jgi:hypothetical protein
MARKLTALYKKSTRMGLAILLFSSPAVGGNYASLPQQLYETEFDMESIE